jgi:hypothetical protein
MRTVDPAPFRHPALAALAGIWVLFAAQYAWVAGTNFSGYDEWLYVSLSSQRIIDYPFENRPLVYLWRLPPALLWPHSVTAYYAAHGLYLVFTASLVFALVRRLVPGNLLLAFLAGVFTAVWAPTDHARLNTLGLTAYSGLTLGTVLAIVLFVEAWVRRRAALLAAAMVIAFVTARGSEVAVPLFVGTPLLLRWLPGGDKQRRWTWIAAWECVALVAGALALWPVVFPPAVGNRQHVLGLDVRPASMLGRLLEQFGFHVLPAVTTPPSELAYVAVALSAALGWFFFRLVAAAAPPLPGREERRPLAELGALGLLLAALGYAAFCMTGSLALPVRTQFFAGPGIALALAAAVLLAVSFVPPRWRQIAGGALMVWVVAVSTGRTLAMQRDWTVWSTYPAQNAVLSQLTALAPDLKPNTLVLLLDDPQAFKATFTFHHAVSYLYQRRASGMVWGASDFLYPCHFVEDGVRCEPWPVIQKAWRSPPSFHRYDEVVVVRFGRDGRLSLLEHWPHEVAPAPRGARYAPLERIVRGGRPLPERGILRP